MHAILLWSSFCLPLLAFAQAAPPSSPVDDLLRAQEAAWHQGDPNAWAAAFTDDADFVNVRGTIFHGRTQIIEQHRLIFGGPYKGTSVAITVRALRMPSPDLAIVDTVQRVTGFQSLPPGVLPTHPGTLEALMKYIAVRQNGQWHFVAAQNTSVLPPPPGQPGAAVAPH